ncbi:MAG TPA: DHH family phosphoesterase [Clostridiaceae bacterium]|jgi:phosphoesterase recJ domain protein|nr:DHH family phosphoesterase [Clostridium sp.]MEE0127817.1 DHH family phosphoesterase [Clostridia bacterium]HJJ11845.1 DHH family phosphoesterase [Clostridiaceae bacterium]
MLNNNRFLEKITSRTKIYLAIIAFLIIIICINRPKLIIPGILLFVLIIIYSYWTNSKRNAELSRQIQNLTMTMDGTAKKSLINSPFPLIIIETTGNIIWKSSKFVYEFANIDINNYLIDILEEIKEDIKAEQDKKQKTIVKKVQIGNKVYSVLGEYIRSKNEASENITILYFIDITQSIKEKKKYEDSKTCIGILTVDNYEEIIQRIEVENRPQVIAEIEKVIYEWASSTGGIVIKNDRNTFIYVFEYKYLKEIKENKFGILDQIKEINVEAGIQLTLSIAISTDGETNYEKYKTALESMDIVLGRGGDQAVIKEDGKYVFFGGRTEEIEKRTKVKARTVAHALENLIKESENVLIMGHSNGDIDSMGSSLGVYRLAKTLEKEVNIVNNTYGMTLSKFIEELEKDDEYKNAIISKNEALNKATNKTLLIITDTHKQNYVEVPELLDKASEIVIIDHHRRSTDYIENATLTFQEVYASSASELVTEILQYTDVKIKLKPIEVEGLYGGIMVDTKNFTFKTGVRTFEAAAYLRKCGVDIIKVKKWFQSDLNSYNEIANIVRNAEMYENSIAIAIYDKEDKDANLICAKAADELLTISDITASFVLGNVGDKICISGRSIGDVNVQLILEKLGGGGHITLAGAQVEGMTLEEVKQELINRINEYFSEIVN